MCVSGTWLSDTINTLADISKREFVRIEFPLLI